MTAAIGDCAVHPQVAAEFTCDRCGAFACAACEAVDGRCLACHRRDGDLARGEVSTVVLLIDSVQLTMVHWRRASALALLVAIAGEAVELLVRLLLSVVPGTEDQLAIAIGVSAPIGAIAPSFGEAAWISVIASSALLAPPTVGQSILSGWRRAAPLLLCNLISALGIAIGMMACIVPGLVLAAGWCLAGPAVVLSGLGPFQALGRSTALMPGSRVSVMLALTITGALGGAVSAKVGLVQDLVLKALEGHLPDAVLTWLQIPIGLTVEFCAVLSAVPLATVPVLAYLRLSAKSNPT